MVSRTFTTGLLALCTVLLSGCMTMIDTFSGVHEIEGKYVPGPRIYGGLRMTLYRIEHELIPLNPGAEAWYYAVEIPVSLCLDTVMLPLSITNELIIHGGRGLDATPPSGTR